MNVDYVNRPEFVRLWEAARRTWQRNGGLRGEARVDAVTEAEAFELAGFLTWQRRQPRAGMTVRASLPRLDERLRVSGVAPSLSAVLEHLGGPLRNAPVERAAASDAWEEVWAAAAEHPAAANPRTAEWLERLRASGALKRAAPGNERATLLACLDVLHTLPRDGVELSRLASEVLDDPHALDYNTALGSLTGAGLAFMADRERVRSAAEWRAQWARVGVLCDALSCNVLVLGLRPTGTGAVAQALRLLADAGEPAVITLRQLARETLHVEHETVFICENPAVVSAAAERHGHTARPLVCGGGWPNTAVSALLEGLQAGGCELRYQGDFDADGLRIAEHVARRHGAVGWRSDTRTYKAGLRGRGTTTEDSWRAADSLAAAVAATGIAVYEEDVVDALLADLG